MDKTLKTSIWDSIATKLLLVVLALYLLIAAVVTVGHFWVEYRYQRANIIQDLGDIESAFKNGLAVNLWGLDQDALNASVKGMLMIPTLVGVKINTDARGTVAIGGIVSEFGKTGDVGIHINISGLKDVKNLIHQSEPYNLEMFEHQFPITYNLEGKSRVLGQATVYSNSSVIYRTMKLQGTMHMLTVLLTLLTFSLALLWAVNRYLRKPLGILTKATSDISLGNLASFSVDSKTSGDNEIKILENTIISMVANLDKAISERNKTDKALRRSEELYRSLVENIDLGITLIDKDHNIIMANAAQGRLFTKATSEFVGKECFKEFEKRDRICPHCPGVGAMNNGLPEETITQGLRDDGSSFTVNIKAFPFQGDDGENNGFIEVVQDITDQLATQENLAAEKERLAVTLRSIGDGVITTDISGNVVLLNKVAEKLTGWSNDEAAGRPLEKVFHIVNEQTGVICENPVTKVLTTGQIIALANHTVLIARDGMRRSIADSGAPILDAESNIIGVVLVFRDVTDQARTEKELLKVKKLESIGLLAGGIAHDFNNILSAIMGNINLALYDTNLKDSTKELLSSAEKASIRAKDLTQQLLTFSKGGEPVKETSSLESVVRDSANFVLHGDKVVCHYEIPEDLWLVDIDKGQMSQVIQNVILNASHAMPDGGVIEVTCENVDLDDNSHVVLLPNGQFVKISIRDSGIGMPGNVVDNIFDPYFSTKQEGSGLGLAISQSIINKHHGDISVESSPGVGSTFTIYLPASEKPEVLKQESTADNKVLLRKNILVMDDEEMVRTMVQKMLGVLGHDVVLAADGEEAVKLYQQSMNSEKPFDLVIMDLTIPGGMGGEKAVQEVLKLDPNAKAIVSSGYSNDPIMANFREYGFCSTIVKPYVMRELSNVIEQVIDK